MLLNFYLPWDMAYLTQAQTHIVKAIGACVSVGILIFAIIAGVRLITTIVKYFTR